MGYTLCPTRNARVMDKPTRAGAAPGFCLSPASKKLTDERSKFVQCARWSYATIGKVSLVKVGPRHERVMAEKLAQLQDKFHG